MSKEILVVDDNSDIRLLISSILKDKGFSVRTAANFDQALLEINKKFRILKKGQNALDIGASPGGWSQILSQKVYSDQKRNAIVSVDLKDFKPIDNVLNIKKNIYDDDFFLIIKKYFSDGIDIIVSDAAPSTTGNKFVDHIKNIELCERSFEIAKNLLNKGGILVIKIFDGEETERICNLIKKKFLQFNFIKLIFFFLQIFPNSSDASATVYLILWSR